MPRFFSAGGSLRSILPGCDSILTSAPAAAARSLAGVESVTSVICSVLARFRLSDSVVISVARTFITSVDDGIIRPSCSPFEFSIIKGEASMDGNVPFAYHALNHSTACLSKIGFTIRPSELR